MPYAAEIKRDNPCLVVILIDQSESMEDVMPHGQSKAEFVAEQVNSTLEEMVIRCVRGEEIRNYFHVAVIGYGNQTVASATKSLCGGLIHTIEEIGRNPLRVDEHNMPVWIEKTCEGDTPTCQAFQYVADLVKEWVHEHRTSFPPTILNLTDGECTDDPELERLLRSGELDEECLKATSLYRRAEALQSITTDDGRVLLLNCHISTQGGDSVSFPAKEDVLPDLFSRLLFRISSPLVPDMCQQALDLGLNIEEGAKGLVYNGDADSVVYLFNIGTRQKRARLR